MRLSIALMRDGFKDGITIPEEQRVRFLNMAHKIKVHPDFQTKYVDNPDSHTRELAYMKIFNEVMNRQRRDDLELYKRVSQDDIFKSAVSDILKRLSLSI